jgi:hypothetical protein
MSAVISPVDNITWEGGNGVPITEAQKIKWIEEAIEFLKDNPDEQWTSIASGDTHIKVSRGLADDYYLVEEFEPRRYAFIERDPADISACICDMQTINSKGCQCGGI